MNKPSLILIGAGGHAHVCIDVIEQQGQFEIAGLIGMPAEVNATHFFYKVIGTDSDLPALSKIHHYAMITVGHIQSPDLRMRLYQRAIETGFQLPAIVSPTAYVSRHASIGAGSIVMHGAIVNAGARVGNNCIINSRALIEHDVTIGDHCHISTGAVLNGTVSVGAGSFIGSGSVVRETIAIGTRCLVGMGLALRHDLKDGARFVGDTDHQKSEP
jgi:sugar O-acyltransferase (sialic acid O-acetyltransferase NeuD family)